MGPLYPGLVDEAVGPALSRPVAGICFNILAEGKQLVSNRMNCRRLVGSSRSQRLARACNSAAWYKLDIGLVEPIIRATIGFAKTEGGYGMDVPGYRLCLHNSDEAVHNEGTLEICPFWSDSIGEKLRGDFHGLDAGVSNSTVAIGISSGARKKSTESS